MNSIRTVSVLGVFLLAGCLPDTPIEEDVQTSDAHEHDESSTSNALLNVVGDEPSVERLLLSASARSRGSSEAILLNVDRPERSGVLTIYSEVVADKQVPGKRRMVYQASEDREIALSLEDMGLAEHSAGHGVVRLSAEFKGPGIQWESAPLVYGWESADGNVQVFDTGRTPSPTAVDVHATSLDVAEGAFYGGVAIAPKVARKTLPDNVGSHSDLSLPGTNADVSASSSSTIGLCLQHRSLYRDSGDAGEDYWTSSQTTARASRGIYARVYKRSSAGSLSHVWSGYTGDGIGTGDPGKGCTGDIATTGGVFRVYLYSKGEVQGNTLEVRGTSGNVRYGYLETTVATNSVATVPFEFSDTDVQASFNVLSAASMSLYRHSGGLSTAHYSLRRGACPGSSGSCWNGQDIWICSGCDSKKFIISHEMGHALLSKAVTKSVSGFCNTHSGGSTCSAAGGQHSMMSHEDSRCALSEGFAHFYAADTWNNHYETDCKYEYYKDELRNGDNTPAIDCELSDSNFPTNALGSVCGSWLQANHGTELDWLRTFWDMHTRANGPSFTSIVRWIDSAEPWQAHQCSSKLDDEAGDLGGQLGAAWDVYGSYNGVVQ